MLLSKSYRTELISMFEKWRQISDKKGDAGAVLMNLSKVLDTINHELLIAELLADGISKHPPLILSSYLSNRKQSVKINNTFCSGTDLIHSSPQRSVLGPFHSIFTERLPPLQNYFLQ